MVFCVYQHLHSYWTKLYLCSSNNEANNLCKLSKYFRPSIETLQRFVSEVSLRLTLILLVPPVIAFLVHSMAYHMFKVQLNM